MTESEDFFSEALEFLGGQPIKDDTTITYGSLVLTLAPKEGKANTLLADQLFSPSLFLTERIERGLLNLKDRTVVELGAGSGLPSLFLCTRPEIRPSLILVTDYPNDGILGNLMANVERNRLLVSSGCTVECRGYQWGSDTIELLGVLAAHDQKLDGYDAIILSDLLYFLDSHDVLVKSIELLLSRSKEARAYIGAGKYTPPNVCDNFIKIATSVGLILDEIIDEDGWLGTLPVNGLSKEELELRKANCRFWVGRWSPDHIQT